MGVEIGRRPVGDDRERAWRALRERSDQDSFAGEHGAEAGSCRRCDDGRPTQECASQERPPGNGLGPFPRTVNATQRRYRFCRAHKLSLVQAFTKLGWSFRYNSIRSHIRLIVMDSFYAELHNQRREADSLPEQDRSAWK